MRDDQPSDEWIEAANCLATVARTVASAVHEANNMLQVIGGSAEMIQLQGRVPDSVLKRATVIAEHAQRISALLASMRDLSKYPPRREGETTDLSAVVNSALDLRKHALTRGRVAVAVHVLDEARMVRASWRPMMQVVLNLLLNAEEAVIGHDQPSIIVRARREGDEVRLSVSDNGAGMPESTDRFALHEFDDAAPLLGLGLIGVRAALAREGGRLEMQSSGDGTTAVATLAGA